MFVREFGLPISRERALQVFNKVSDLRKPISFDQFVKVLDKLSLELNEYCKDQTKKRLKNVTKLIAQQQKKIQNVGLSQTQPPQIMPSKEKDQPISEGGDDENMETKRSVQFKEDVEVREFDKESKIQEEAKKEENNMQIQVYQESTNLVERREKLEQGLI